MFKIETSTTVVLFYENNRCDVITLVSFEENKPYDIIKLNDTNLVQGLYHIAQGLYHRVQSLYHRVQGLYPGASLIYHKSYKNKLMTL